MAVLDRAEADAAVGAVVIRAEGQIFSTGVELGDLDQVAAAPTLSALCERIEDFPKPVLIALAGPALGGGFELALAAHWRLAGGSAQLGFPDVKQGVLPGAGGTVRAPRLAGADAVLDLMLSGRPVGAERAAELGLIDDVVPVDLDAAALALGHTLADQRAGRRPTRERAEGFAEPADYMQAVRARRRAMGATPVRAEARIVDCVEAALLLPFAEALAYEQTAFAECLDTRESRALRHAFLAEGRAGRVSGLAPGLAREV
jgi:3-hydroxyacyl-CoA dehydrogenase